MLRKIKKLSKGATACIVSPSYGTTNTAIIKNTEEIIRTYGFSPVMYGTMNSEAHSLYYKEHLRFANTDELRLNYTYAALTDDSCDVVWSFRGGYGCY